MWLGAGVAVLVVGAAALAGTSGSGTSDKGKAPLNSEQRAAVTLAKMKSSKSEGLPSSSSCGASYANFRGKTRVATRGAHGSANFNPTSFRQLDAKATVLTYAEVVSITHRRNPLAPRFTKAPKGALQKESLTQYEESVQDEIVTMRTCKDYKGSAGKTFKLYRMGSANYQVGADNPYSVGERYVLFLRKRVTGTRAVEYILVSPAGKLFLKPDGRIAAKDDNMLAQALNGLPGVDAMLKVVNSDLPVPDHEPPLTAEQIKHYKDLAKGGNFGRASKEYGKMYGHQEGTLR